LIPKFVPNVPRALTNLGIGPLAATGSVALPS
jgi:hypothetical protein